MLLYLGICWAFRNKDFQARKNTIMFPSFWFIAIMERLCSRLLPWTCREGMKELTLHSRSDIRQKARQTPHWQFEHVLFLSDAIEHDLISDSPTSLVRISVLFWGFQPAPYLFNFQFPDYICFPAAALPQHPGPYVSDAISVFTARPNFLIWNIRRFRSRTTLIQKDTWISAHRHTFLSFVSINPLHACHGYL